MFRAPFLVPSLLGLLTWSMAWADETKVIITVETPQTAATESDSPFTGPKASVDVAILLDTSNSMDGLINQAKSQLWTIVQQFSKAKKDGQTPLLRVALFEYGNTRLPVTEGYLRQVVPLTDDLDQISKELFSLSTQGGDEYCGQVIDEAITRLAWSQEPNGYRAIFIAGNEPFTQGTVSYRSACKRAIEHGVVVNTIHCGDRQAGVSGMWQHGAELAEGKYFTIDQDRIVSQVKCPQDALIIELNTELNRTYLWFGNRSERRERAMNQAAQDANALQASESVAVDRSIIKAGSMYGHRGRDLVDALNADQAILEKVAPEELPEELATMSPSERRAHVEAAAARRAELQRKIGELAAAREAYLAQALPHSAETDGATTLGDAIATTIQSQLGEAGFEFSRSTEE